MKTPETPKKNAYIERRSEELNRSQINEDEKYLNEGDIKASKQRRRRKRRRVTRTLKNMLLLFPVQSLKRRKRWFISPLWYATLSLVK